MLYCICYRRCYTQWWPYRVEVARVEFFGRRGGGGSAASYCSTYRYVEHLDRVNNRVEDIATNLDDTKAGVEGLVPQVTTNNDDVHRMREVLHQLISSGAGKA